LLARPARQHSGGADLADRVLASSETGKSSLDGQSAGTIGGPSAPPFPREPPIIPCLHTHAPTSRTSVTRASSCDLSKQRHPVSLHWSRPPMFHFVSLVVRYLTPSCNGVGREPPAPTRPQLPLLQTSAASACARAEPPKGDTTGPGPLRRLRQGPGSRLPFQYIFEMAFARTASEGVLSRSAAQPRWSALGCYGRQINTLNSHSPK
jgi:hypothetical protein